MDVQSYLDGELEGLKQEQGGIASVVGATGVAIAETCSRFQSDGSIWNGMEAGNGLPAYVPGVDSVGAHGIGFLSAARIAMEPSEFPMKYVTGGRDIPDYTKPLIGVVGVGMIGGWAIKEGYMEYGVHNIDTAGQFVTDVVNYNVHSETAKIDPDDYWDMVFDVVPTAIYSQWKGYNSALRDKIDGLYQESVDGS